MWRRIAKVFFFCVLAWFWLVSHYPFHSQWGNNFLLLKSLCKFTPTYLHSICFFFFSSFLYLSFFLFFAAPYTFLTLMLFFNKFYFDFLFFFFICRDALFGWCEEDPEAFCRILMEFSIQNSQLLWILEYFEDRWAVANPGDTQLLLIVILKPYSVPVHIKNFSESGKQANNLSEKNNHLVFRH